MKKSTEEDASDEIGPLLIVRSEHIAEYRKRKSKILQQKLEEPRVAKAIEEGWQVGRKLKSGKTILEKRKTHDEILENRLWSVVYNFGALELSAGRNFRIPVTSDGSKVTEKIDVFAKFDDVVVVAECRSATTKKKKQLQGDIGIFASLQRPIANALRRIVLDG